MDEESLEHSIRGALQEHEGLNPDIIDVDVDHQYSDEESCWRVSLNFNATVSVGTAQAVLDQVFERTTSIQEMSVTPDGSLISFGYLGTSDEQTYEQQ